MPNLIRHNGNFEVLEYFPNATYFRNKWEYDIDTEYPFVCFAHCDLPDKRLLKDIRLYIYNYGKDDVFYKKVSKSYGYCYNLKEAKYSWDENWENINNNWYQFFFGSEVDQTLLMLKHDQLQMSASAFHPEKEWHTQENTRSR